MVNLFYIIMFNLDKYLSISNFSIYFENSQLHIPYRTYFNFFHHKPINIVTDYLYNVSILKIRYL